jgi:hypothetical protein
LALDLRPGLDLGAGLGLTAALGVRFAIALNDTSTCAEYELQFPQGRIASLSFL